MDIDPNSKRVLLADETIVPYDSLIVAAGSQISYFGNNEWQEWAPGMKSVEEATAIRHKILYAFEVAERLSDPVQRRSWLTFVVVAAGPTGVELSGAIAEISRQTLKNDSRSIRPEEAQIILLDGAPRVLMPFPEDLAGSSGLTIEGEAVVWPNMFCRRLDLQMCPDCLHRFHPGRRNPSQSGARATLPSRS